jgi:hypothetical protein
MVEVPLLKHSCDFRAPVLFAEDEVGIREHAIRRRVSVGVERKIALSQSDERSHDGE